MNWIGRIRRMGKDGEGEEDDDAKEEDDDEWVLRGRSCSSFETLV